MTDLLTRPLLRRDGPLPRAPWVAAMLAGTWSLVAGVVLVQLPVLIGWLAGGADQPLHDPLRLGAQVWLLAHRVGLDLDPGFLGVAPWGLTVLVLLLLYRAGRWAAHASGAPYLVAAARLVAVMSAVYAAGALVLALVCRTDSAYARPIEAGVNAALIAVVGSSARTPAESGLGAALLEKLPPRIVGAVRAGMLGAAAAYVGGAVLATISLIAHFGRASDLTASLEAGAVGGLLLTVISAALLPNAAMWATSYALGPGFAVGSGTEVTPGHVDLGPVPALPVLAGLPAGTAGLLSWVVLAIPVVAGVLVARRLQTERQLRSALTGSAESPVHGRVSLPALTDRVVDALAAAAVSAGLLGLMAALSGGSAGPGRLVDVGPAGSWVALWALVEIGTVAATVSVVAALVHRDRSGESTDVSSSVGPSNPS